jgi:hypothetical protein
MFEVDDTEIDGWLDGDKPVPKEAQTLISAILDVPRRDLFTDLPPEDKTASRPPSPPRPEEQDTSRPPSPPGPEEQDTSRPPSPPGPEEQTASRPPSPPEPEEQDASRPPT